MYDKTPDSAMSNLVTQTDAWLGRKPGAVEVSGEREAQQLLAAAQETAQQIHGLGAGGNKPMTAPPAAGDAGAAQQGSSGRTAIPCLASCFCSKMVAENVRRSFGLPKPAVQSELLGLHVS